MLFLRGTYSQLEVTLNSDEELGLLDSNYLEDYYGTDGQVSIKAIATGTRSPLLMTEVGLPPHTIFKGFLPLADVADGRYEIQGRVRDRWGNYTILGESSQGTGRLYLLPFTIVSAIPPLFCPKADISLFRHAHISLRQRSAIMSVCCNTGLEKTIYRGKAAEISIEMLPEDWIAGSILAFTAKESRLHADTGILFSKSSPSNGIVFDPVTGKGVVQITNQDTAMLQEGELQCDLQMIAGINTYVLAKDVLRVRFPVLHS